VLEFGCGTGIDSYYIAKLGANVTACDIVPTNVQVVKRLLEPDLGTGILIREYSELETLGEFDLVYSHGVLHHIPNVSEVIPYLIKCIRPGGNLLTMVYTKEFYPYENRHPEGPYTRGYDKDELKALFEPGLKWRSDRIYMNGNFRWAIFEKNLVK
jgi:SAM-dependent methyltransferase